MDMSEKALAPLFGYSSIEEYYDDTQSVGRLHKIKVPTFFLNAIDDPCINESLYPYKEFENNDFIVAGFTKRGGHCGHFTGGLRPFQWFPIPYMEFLDHIESKTRSYSEKPISHITIVNRTPDFGDHSPLLVAAHSWRVFIFQFRALLCFNRFII